MFFSSVYYPRTRSKQEQVCPSLDAMLAAPFDRCSLNQHGVARLSGLD
jgi:hypothetical protein